MFPARIGCNITADGAGPEARRVGGKYVGQGGVFDPSRHGTALGCNGRDLLPVNLYHLYLTDTVKPLRINDHRILMEGHCAAAEACAAATGNDDEIKLHRHPDDMGDLLLSVGGNDHKGVLLPPVGRVGCVTYTAEWVKVDVIPVGHPGKGPQNTPPQLFLLTHIPVEGIQHPPRLCHHLQGNRVARCPTINPGKAILLEGTQPSHPLRVISQVVSDKGVA